jgi:hypothetical protein
MAEPKKSDLESSLGKLHRFCHSDDVTIKKLGILSEFAVFKDLLPE